jgi:hypothetical protein
VSTLTTAPPQTPADKRLTTYILAYAERFGRLPRRTPAFTEDVEEDA